MTKKQFIRSVAFFLVVAIMVFALCDLFESENSSNYNQRFYSYRNFPEDTIDAVILGTSGIDRYWIPSQAYEEYGMTVYPLSTDAFPPWLYIEAVKEALKHQNLELLIIDIRPFTLADYDADEMDVRARRFLDALPQFSLNRITGCLKTMEIRNRVDSSVSRVDLSYLFPIIKFHSKWSSKNYLVSDNWSNTPHEYMGFNVVDRATARRTPQKNRGYDADYYLELDKYVEECLYEFLDYLKGIDREILFLDTPQIRLDDEAGRSNTIYKILEEEGFKCLHYYDENSENTFTIDLSIEADFYNEGHTNFYGATKFTTVFSEYLSENYKLTDRRNDEKVKKEWDGIHDKLLAKIGALEEAARLKAEQEANKQ